MRGIALAAGLAALLLGSLARANEIAVTDARLRAVEQGIVLDADFAFELTPRLAEALANGVPLYFRVDFALTRSRWYWWDETAAEGELQAATKLGEAAAVIASNPSAMQLRMFQTLTEISSEPSAKIVIPIPIELMAGISQRGVSSEQLTAIVQQIAEATRPQAKLTQGETKSPSIAAPPRLPAIPPARGRERPSPRRWNGRS